MRGGRYYTRSRRVNGRVLREYVGTGAVGELAALLDAEERVEREAARDLLMAEQSRARDVSGALRTLDLLTLQAVADVLRGEGFHQHKGQWRRRREHA